MSYICTTSLVINPTQTLAATVGMRTPCPPALEKGTLGLLGMIWAAISGFFGTVVSIVGRCLQVIFGTLLPAALAIAIVFVVLSCVVGLIIVLADRFGWIGFYKTIQEKQREQEEEKKKKKKERKVQSEKVEVEGFSRGEGDIGSDEEIIDLANKKTRIEVEIEFLEALLQVKREKLELIHH
ncbi:hypothetical protein BDV12DRAFT_174332 [Aspergillus spectabilis]